MKIRTGFVSNSSSMSFIVKGNVSIIEIAKQMVAIIDERQGSTPDEDYPYLQFIENNPDYDGNICIPWSCNYGTYIYKNAGVICVETSINHPWSKNLGFEYEHVNDDLDDPRLRKKNESLAFLDFEDMHVKTKKKKWDSDWEKREEAIQGCILGGALGDSMGSPYEGKARPVEVTHRGDITDDTQMTLATCEALIQQINPSPEIIARSLTRWYQDNKITGMGAATLMALQAMSKGGHWAVAGRTGEMSQGNGAAVRISPLAFCLNPENREDRVVIRDVCRITHKNDEAYVGALAICLAIYYVKNGAFENDGRLLPRIIEQLPDSKVRDRMVQLQQVSEDTSIQETGMEFGTSGYVVDSVPFAIYCAEKITGPEGIDEILTRIVFCGGDTDSIASMAGQIMGTHRGYYGVHVSLPRQNVKEEIESIAYNFADRVCIAFRE